MGKFDFSVEWLDVVAHDLKNPIYAIQASLELLQSAGELNDAQKVNLERSFRGLKRMNRLLERLRDMSWVDSTTPIQPVPVQLKPLIEETVDWLSHLAKPRLITFQVQIDETSQVVYADPDRLGQVLDNLVSNAIKYNKRNGTVTISVSPDSYGVRISVTDTGVGIKQEDLPLVFDRFFRSENGSTRKIEGSGLGLAIARGIVERHGGFFELFSEVGQGSVFSFVLPHRYPAAEEDELMGDQPPAQRESSDHRKTQEVELSSEVDDSVDDSFQEHREISEVDSTGDDT
jgi:two-component system, OmpR family, phosphate regulon sensor histidine kinase PhoR